MKKLVLVVLACCFSFASANSSDIQLAGPGGGGWLYAAAFDPLNPDTMLIGTDMCGVYRSIDAGISWEPWNEGLLSDRGGERDQVSYVQDLIGIPRASGTEFYAATIGGIFKRTASGPWIRDTDYTYGYTNLQFDQYLNNRSVPFSCLAYDGVGVLYAGAGTNRTSGHPDNWWGSGLEHYPGLGLSVDYEEYLYGDFTPEGGLNCQYTVWSKPADGSGPWTNLNLSCVPSVNEPSGAARDISVARLDIGGVEKTYVVVSTHMGIYLYVDGVWSNLCDLPLYDNWGEGPYINYYQDNLLCWDVHLTPRGTLYASMHLHHGDDTSIPGGVYKIHNIANSNRVWQWVGDNDPIYEGVVGGLPADLRLSMAEAGIQTTNGIQVWDSSGNVSYPTVGKNLWLMDVVDGVGTANDVILLGSRFGSGHFNMLRCDKPWTEAGEPVDDPNGDWDVRVFYNDVASLNDVQQFANGVDNLLAFDEGHVTNWGGHLIFQPVVFRGVNDPLSGSRILAQYNGMLHMSSDYGMTWDNVYGEWQGSAWKTSGYEEIAPIDIGFHSDGRALITCPDTGVYSSTSPEHGAWVWPPVFPVYSNRRGGGVEIMDSADGSEVMLVVVDTASQKLTYSKHSSGMMPTQMLPIPVDPVNPGNLAVKLRDLEMVTAELFFASYRLTVSEGENPVYIYGVLRGVWDVAESEWVVTNESPVTVQKTLTSAMSESDAYDLEYVPATGMLYAVTSAPPGLHRLIDVATSNWTDIQLPVTDAWTSSGRSIFEISASMDGSVLYLGSSRGTLENDYRGYLLKVDNADQLDAGLLTWTQYEMPIETILSPEEAHQLSTVAVSRVNPDIVYVGINLKGSDIEEARNNIGNLRRWNGLWRLDVSDIGNPEWTYMFENTTANGMTVHDVEFNPYVPGQLLIGTAGMGLYVLTTDDEPASAKYVDGTSYTGLDYTGQPYASLPIDHDMDGDQDLVITFEGQPKIGLYTNNGNNNGSPVLYAQTDAFAPIAESAGTLRGITMAEIDPYRSPAAPNLPLPDLLVCSDGAELLFNNTQSESTLFELNTIYVMPGDAFNKSWSIAWTDFNGDGYLDVFVSRAEALPGEYRKLDPNAPLISRLFGGGADDFYTVLDGVTPLDVTNAATSASWANVDNVGRPELFVPSAGDALVSRFYTIDNGLQDGWSSIMPVEKFGYCGGAAWSDMNGDGYLDLIAANSIGPARLFLNDGQGVFNEASGRLAGSASSADVRPLDYDLDGWMDLLLTGDTNTSTIALWRNLGTDAGGVPVFVEVTVDVGLDQDACLVGGLSVADFNLDGDLDIYLGREKVLGRELFYAAKRADEVTDEPINNWLGLRLFSLNGINTTFATGAQVTVSWAGRKQCQIVDGGSGNGGQQTHDLRFGLGDYSGDVEIEVLWPAGNRTQMETVSVPTGGLHWILYDDTTPAYVESTLARATYFVPPTKLLWIIEWDTETISLPDQDLVELVLSTGQTVEYHPGDADVVAHTMTAQPDGRYHHYMAFLSAGGTGNYTYTAKSSTNGYTKLDGTTVPAYVSEAVGTHTIPVSGKGDPDVQD